MRNCVTLAVLVISMFGLTSEAFGTSSGIIRRSTLNTPGCGSQFGCHGPSPTEKTKMSITQAKAGKILIAPGKSIALTLRIENPDQAAAGCNIAVKTEENGSDDIGSLAPGANADLHLDIRGKELTQNSPMRFKNDGSYDFEFSWTAPMEEGTYFLHAAGNAVNLNGSNDPGDDWAWLEPVEITVSGTSSVAEFGNHGHGASIHPMPAHGSVSISAPVLSGQQIVVQILDATGTVIRTASQTASSDSFLYVWDGRTNNGSVAAPGAYTAAILSDRSVYTGKVLLVR